MASTILSNIIEPTSFARYIDQQTTLKTALINSGIVARSPLFDGRAGEGGSVSHLPFFNALDNSDPDVASDDPSVLSTPSNITGAEMAVHKDFIAKSWSVMELAEQIAGEDIVANIGGKVANYWSRQLQKRACAMLGSIALDNPDMSKDISIDTSSALTSANLASFASVIDAKQTLGDASDQLQVIIMHSQVYANLMKSELTSFTQPSTVQPFVTYNGMRVIKDDNGTVVQGANKPLYTTFLMAPGSFVYGEAAIDNAVEVWRNPAAGNSYGEERLYSRKKLFLHPVGFSANPTITSRSKSPTLAQWAATGAFTRVYDRKNVPIAMLKTNG